VLDAGYVDCFRKVHPQEDGFTLPSPHPQVHLDYVFAPPPLDKALRACRVVRLPWQVVLTQSPAGTDGVRVGDIEAHGTVQ
jgi:hypothetical protein